MTAAGAGAALMAAAAVIVAGSAPAAGHRLRAVLSGSAPTTPRRRQPTISPAGARRLASGAGALGVAVVLGGWKGVLLGGAAGLGVERALRAMEPAAVRRRRVRILLDLPPALDLVAACLAGGSPLGAALEVVGEATGGPLGAVLQQVAGASRLGAAATQAWLPVDGPPELVAVGRAIARVADSGAALSDTIVRLAADQRRRAAASAAESVRRAGVLAVLPLGLCFLPAFVLIGIVPVVAGVARHLLS
ncbi:MAG: type II secretion system F family protein [Actinomycetota bacterium]|nr:type II secretion system F family protein [Actinomycetota bacterium]